MVTRYAWWGIAAGTAGPAGAIDVAINDPGSDRRGLALVDLELLRVCCFE